MTKKRGLGTIYKRGNTYWIQYFRNGRRYQESCESSKKMVASQLLKRRLGEISQGKQPGIRFDRTTFDELAEGYLNHYKIKKRKSLRSAELYVMRLGKYFGGVAGSRHYHGRNQFLYQQKNGRKQGGCHYQP